MNNNTFFIAKEATRYIGISLFFALLFLLLDWELLAFLVTIKAFVFAYMFRNPERVTTHFQNKNIVSVCDGTVKSIENIESSEFFSGSAIKIEIETSYFDTSYLRAPFDAKVSDLVHLSGAQLALNTPLSHKINEHMRVKFSNDTDVLFVESFSQNSFEPLRVYIENEKTIKATSRIGFMLRGITTIYLPSSARTSLHVGDEIKASESLIGYFSDNNE